MVRLTFQQKQARRAKWVATRNRTLQASNDALLAQMAAERDARADAQAREIDRATAAAQPSARYQRKAEQHQAMAQATTGERQSMHAELARLYRQASEQASYLENTKLVHKPKYASDVAACRARSTDKLAALKQAIRAQEALLKGVR